MQRNGILISLLEMKYMSDSILDRVISHQEDQQKEEFDPTDIVSRLLRELSNKEADIVRRRFGLTESKRKETLETIGAEYNVTRERIRQIENHSITKIRQSQAFADFVKPVEHLVMNLLEHHGGIMTKELLYEQLLGLTKDNPEQRQATAFIVTQLLRDKISTVAKSSKFDASWRLKIVPVDSIQEGMKALESLVDSIGEPLTFDELYKRFQETEYYKQREAKLTEEVVLSYVEASAKIARNPFDEYGLAKWGSIVPKRMNDRVMLVLKKEGEPMHFEEIAERISSIFHKKAYPPTVHNELILNDEYVLVGRGIYALRDWGYKEGVVADVIVDILKQAHVPLSRSEIVERVLEQRIVKANTIHLSLTDKALFKKTKDGKYMLAGAGESGAPTA